MTGSYTHWASSTLHRLLLLGSAEIPIKILDTLPLDGYAVAFRVAVRLHNYAHSPFSHALEAYIIGRTVRRCSFSSTSTLNSEGLYVALQVSFIAEGSRDFQCGSILKYFGEKFSTLGAAIDPTLVARMITGCTHWEPTGNREQFENCLITLINGAGVDVDKLDYILRDTWASGVNNVTIDVQRLAGGFGGSVKPEGTEGGLSEIRAKRRKKRA